MNQQLSAQQEQHKRNTQRLQLGMGERHQKRNDELRPLRQQLDIKQTMFDDQTKILDELLDDQT